MSAHQPLTDMFRALDQFLVQYQALWRPKPFTELELPWEHDHPELARWLRGRTLAEAEAAHNRPDQLSAPSPFPELASQSRALSQLTELPSTRATNADARLGVDVPGRKWQQIQSLCSTLAFNETPTHWLDWCAGKGHLGRQLAIDGSALTCLERDSALIEAGKRMSQRLGIQAQHWQQDVMAPDAAQHLNASVTPVALHACGDLHVRLLQLAIDKCCKQLAIAPCCYNRTQADGYQPLSIEARKSGLRLSKDDLGLPLSETVTAGARERRQRDQSMAWRLGFDMLQRQIRQDNSYLPTPSLSGNWLKRSFEDFCRGLATLKDLPQPAHSNWASLEQAGWQRLAQVRNLELVRGLFRRPLELWLTLDRALLLEENGYNVRLGTFCSADLTPRNLLLLAERP